MMWHKCWQFHPILMLTSQYLMIRKQQYDPCTEVSTWLSQGPPKVHSPVVLDGCLTADPHLQTLTLISNFCLLPDHYLHSLPAPTVYELKIPDTICLALLYQVMLSFLQSMYNRLYLAEVSMLLDEMSSESFKCTHLGKNDQGQVYTEDVPL